MSEVRPTESVPRGPSGSPTRLYIVIAAVLVVVIVVAGILLVTVGLPALRGDQEPTTGASPEATATGVPTFTPGPTKEPIASPLPSPSPTMTAPIMADPENPLFALESAGARPATEWTGFFGFVQDAAGKPLAGVPVIVWYPEGRPAASVAETSQDGYYEIHLASAPAAGTWTIQVLTDEGGPASELMTFRTDTDTTAGIQQIQVIWKRVP